MRLGRLLVALVVVPAIGCGGGASVPPPNGRDAAAGSSGAPGSAGGGRAGSGGTGGAVAGHAGAAGGPGGGGASGGSAGAAGIAGTTGGASAGAGGGATAGNGGGAAGGSSGRDGGTDAAVVPCDPLVQTSCPANERCAWVATSPTSGYAACLSDGTVAQGGACAAGAAGFDDCQRGLACANGQCQPICKTSPDSCGARFVCTNYSSVFYSNGATLAGVCAPTCNPLTQARDYDGAPACGSPTPATPSLGCFGKSVFTCSKVVYPDNKSDAPAAGPSSGGAFLNGCAPGYLPLLPATTGSAETICVALCRPGPTSAAAPVNAGGVSPATCAAAGAAPPHECRYWWWLENTAAASFPDPLSNTIGFCLDYPKYTGDKSGAGTAPYPSCAGLSATAHGYDAKLTDTQYWGCEPYPTSSRDAGTD